MVHSFYAILSTFLIFVDLCTRPPLPQLRR